MESVSPRSEDEPHDLVQRIVQDGHSAPSVCVPPQLLKCCFTSTETVGLLGTGAQDGHLNFHTAPNSDRRH